MKHHIVPAILLILLGISSCASTQARGTASVREQQRILVIGAGAAGLSTAETLLEEGSSDVLILEARDRIGGRIFTDRQSVGAPIDLGASWIHGVKGNPIAQLAAEAKIALRETVHDGDPELSSETGHFYNSSERDELNSLFASLKKSVTTRKDNLPDGVDISLGQCFNEQMNSMGLTAEQRHQQEHFLATDIENDYNTDATNLSLKYWDEGEDHEGTDMAFPGGYDQIPAFLEKKILSHGGRAKILLRHVVTEIDYGADGVTVVTSDGERFDGKIAVVTLPLGVLKKRAVHFTPELPVRKMAAIDRLGVGVFDKLYLRFENRFWGTNDWIEYMGRDPKRWALFFNAWKITDAPVLVGFNVGSSAVALQDSSDQEVVADAMKTVRAMYGSAIPEPVSFRRTNWGKDPYSQGAYSYVPTGASTDDFSVIAEPVAEKLFFAGEATDSKFFSTVHAAYQSGQRAAREVLSQQKRGRAR